MIQCTHIVLINAPKIGQILKAEINFPVLKFMNLDQTLEKLSEFHNMKKNGDIVEYIIME